MQTEIKKWGNSAVVRLPAPMLSELDLIVGSRIELKHENGRLVIEPVRPVREGWFATPIAADEDVFATIPPDEGDDEWVW
jgi:antitoxin MazE